MKGELFLLSVLIQFVIFGQQIFADLRPNYQSDKKASLTQEYEKPEVQNLSDNILSPAKRNYQYIWRNVAQQMPLRETHVASGFKHLDVNKRNYQHIWRNIADRMPKENYLSEITNDYRGPYN